MERDSPMDPDRIREAIRSCPDVGSDSWIVGLSIRVKTGERIEGTAIYLDDPDTAVLRRKDGDLRVPISEITNVISDLQSPGPE